MQCQRILLFACAVAVFAAQTSQADDERLPRKIVVGTSMHACWTFPGQEERIAEMETLLDQMALQAAKQFDGASLDLAVFTEEMLTYGSGRSPAERAVKLDGPELARLRAKAKQHKTNVVVPLTLREHGAKEVFTNAAVVLDRSGETVGVYRKVHPVAPYNSDELEGGITPGDDFPVFECDFGRLGVLICFDMSYPDGWQALAERNAEIVVIPSASPQTVRPAAYAQQNNYYVVTSTPRNNASIFNPIGRIAAQIKAPGVLVHQLDLSYVRLHWSATLDDGKSFTRKYGDKVGYVYYRDEDTGLFWSNDPHIPITQMVAEMGEMEMRDHLQRVQRLQDAAR